MTIQFFKDVYFPEGHRYEGWPVPVSLKIQWGEGNHPRNPFKRSFKPFQRLCREINHYFDNEVRNGDDPFQIKYINQYKEQQEIIEEGGKILDGELITIIENSDELSVEKMKEIGTELLKENKKSNQGKLEQPEDELTENDTDSKPPAITPPASPKLVAFSEAATVSNRAQLLQRKLDLIKAERELVDELLKEGDTAARPAKP